MPMASGTSDWFDLFESVRDQCGDFLAFERTSHGGGVPLAVNIAESQ